MSAPWPMVRLGDVLKRVKEAIRISDDCVYARITIRTNGRGIHIRNKVCGSDIGTKLQFVASQNQFLLSKIDALNGAFGILPEGCDQAVITGNFWAYSIDESLMERGFLECFTRLRHFVEECMHASEGTTNRRYLQEELFLKISIPLPPLGEQRRIVARIEEVATRVESVRRLQAEQVIDIQHTLNGMFSRLIEGAPLRPMSEIAPQVRRGVDIDPDGSYPELGIRSFGKGTFHKPALTALEIGDKRVFRIEPGDLVFSNVFAWEGAIAVVKPKDAGRVGSHRYITCLVSPQEALADFLCFYFLTPDGLEKIRAGSPGGAGRNRTLGLSALDRIEVPVPSLESQREFCKLMHLEKELRAARAATDLELGSMVPSVLSRAFRGEL